MSDVLSRIIREELPAPRLRGPSEAPLALRNSVVGVPPSSYLGSKLNQIFRSEEFLPAEL